MNDKFKITDTNGKMLNIQPQNFSQLKLSIQAESKTI